MTLFKSLPLSLLAAGLLQPGMALAQDAPVPVQPAPAAPTAEVAPAAPVPAPSAPAAEAVSAEAAAPVDLASLGLQDEGGTAGSSSASGETPLQFYGFADISFAKPLFEKDSYLAAQLPSRSTFAMGKFNLYMSKQVSTKIKALGEVRFSYLPNGNYDGNGGRVSTSADDPTDVYRPVSWGGIVIERVQVDYEFSQLLTVRAGQFLTPYGIWNVDHGTPTLIGIRRPYIIGEQLIPERQVGVELFGRTYLGDFRFEYHGTVSNGRGPMAEARDLDENKAVGARGEIQWKGEAEVRLGGSFYRGEYTNRALASFDYATAKASEPITSRYNEQSFGLDLQADWQSIVFRGEYLARDVKYEDRFRATGGKGLVPDNRAWGYYALAGYRLPWLGIMPYALYQKYVFAKRPEYNVLDLINAYQLGVNIQIHPSLIFKAEYSYADLPSDIKFVSDFPYKGLEGQLSWVF